MQKLIKTLLISFGVVFSLNCSLTLASVESDIVRELINHKVTQQKSAIGVSVAIIENNQVEYLNFGLTNLSEKVATSSDTLFEIGSISKTFTSVALASMVNEGKVKLTDPVQNYLPSKVKMPTRNGEFITFLELANHTSGLPRLPDNMPFSDPHDPYADYSVDMMYDFLNDYELTRDIGEKLEYSNLAVGLLGHVLGLIDNKTYQQVINDRVLKPLAMSNSFVDVPASHREYFSDGHDAALNRTKHWKLPTLAGAGAVKSNTKDMALYLKANLSLTPLTKTLALTHQQTTNSELPGTRVGLGWFIVEHEKGKYLWHNGGTGGFRSFMGFDKKNKRGIVILENTTNGMDAIGTAYLTGSLEKLKSDTFDLVHVEEKQLQKLNGHFELMPGFILTVTNDARQLYIQATGQSNLPVYAKSETEFVYRAVKAKVRFELNKNGEAVSLTLYQGGGIKNAKRISSKELVAKNPTVELTKLQLNNLNGEFQLMPNFVIKTRHKDGQLIIQATGQPAIPFETNSKSEFSNGQIQARIVFELDKNGKAVSLTLFQGGQELKGTRVQ